MTKDSTSYLDKCLNYFTDNINCTNNNLSTTPIMFCQQTTTSISPSTSTYSQVETNKSSSSVADTTTPNPFGVKAVGNIKSIFPCKYSESSSSTATIKSRTATTQVSGQLFVTTKALCFQRIGLFGLEIDRVIIPFNIVTAIEKCHKGKNRLSVTTQNNNGKLYIFEFTWNEIDDSIYF